MADDELMAQMLGVILEGVQDGGQRTISRLYNNYDDGLPDGSIAKLDETVEYIVGNLSEVLSSRMGGAPHFLMLFAAVAHALLSIPEGDMGGDSPLPHRDGRELSDLSMAVQNLETLAEVLEAAENEIHLRFVLFKQASLRTTQRIRSRGIRFVKLYEALLSPTRYRRMSDALSELCRDFVDSTNALVRRFDVPVPSYAPFDSTCGMIHEDGQALLVVRLQSSWADFCGSLINISAPNNARRVRCSATYVASDMGYSYPVWHKPEFVVRVARHLTLTNMDRIDLHLGANLSSGDVTAVRNYIVHPGSRTESKYRKVAAAAGVPGADIGTLLNIRFPGGATLFERWVKDLQRTVTSSTA